MRPHTFLHVFALLALVVLSSPINLVNQKYLTHWKEHKIRHNLKQNGFQRYQQFFDGDCMSRGVKAPHVTKAFGPRYIKRKLVENGGDESYLMAVYECQSGYKFLDGQYQNGVLYCSGGKWIGARPICIPKFTYKGKTHVQADQRRMPLVEDNGKHITCKKCRQQFEVCLPDNNQELICVCKPGFKRTNGVCRDVNECKVANPCQHSCTNLPGTYRCYCKPGYRLLPDGESCEDVNECLLRNGHGPCEDKCINLLGSYSCVCEQEGTKLALDGHTCDDVDECDVGTSGCSHGCINTRGRAYCSCPEGMQLDTDWKTCFEKPLGDQGIQDEYYENEGDDEYIDGEEDGEEDYEDDRNRDYGEDEDRDEDDEDDNMVKKDDYEEEKEEEEEEDAPPEYKNNGENTDNKNEESMIQRSKNVIEENDNIVEENQDITSSSKNNPNLNQIIDQHKHPQTNKLEDQEEEKEDDETNETNTTQYIEKSTVPKEDGSKKIAAIIRDLELNFGKDNEDVKDEDEEDEEEEDIDNEEDYGEVNNLAIHEDKLTKDKSTENKLTKDKPTEDKQTEDVEVEENKYEPNEHHIETKAQPSEIKNINNLNPNKTETEKETEEKEIEEIGEEIEEETLTKTHIYQLGHKDQTNININFSNESTPIETYHNSENTNDNKEEHHEKVDYDDEDAIDNIYTNEIILEQENPIYEPDEYDEKTQINYKNTSISISNETTTSITTTSTTTTTTPIPSPIPTTVAIMPDQHKQSEEDDDDNDYEYTYEEYEDNEHENTIPVVTLTTPRQQAQSSTTTTITTTTTTPTNRNECNTGFKLDEINQCIDVNECEDPDNGCSDFCQNTIGSYNCACPEGYEITSKDKYTCVDIDECFLGICSHNCFNVPGTFTCECPTGWILKDNTTCYEIQCQHGYNITEVSPTGYICLCPKGYALDVNATCADINECLDENLCEHDCANTEGGYVCTCQSGYSSIGNDCDDIDECVHDNGGCQQLCANFDGSYECGCEDGFYLDADDKSCLEVNNCVETNGNCSDFCRSVKNGVICECRHGRELQEDGKTCLNINPCHIDNGGCSHECIYKETEGVECACPLGHQLLIDARTCEDINPCFEENGGCSHLCLTSETNPSEAICKCPDDSFKLENKTCYKINPCMTNNGGCSHTCTFYNDEVKCSCPDTFKLFGKVCQKRNLCEENNGGCSHFCNFVNDTIICECPDGFELKGKLCEKIDPCLINNGGCSHTCISEDDEAECHCPINYELMEDEKTCKAIDPCYNNGGCSHFCLAHRGRTLCYCPLGYELKNETTCEKIDLCLKNNGNCSHKCQSHLGKVECQCPSDLVLVNSTLCVNPCSVQNGGCSHECVYENKVKCICPEGFLLKADGKVCEQLNPCLQENGGCSHTCENVNGQVVCKCPQSDATTRYELVGKTCKLIDPCLVNNGGCSHTCVTINEKAKCECPSRYTLLGNGKICFENMDSIPEHTLRKNNSCELSGCSHNCSMKNGIHECLCPTGFILRPNRKTCKDINECIRHNGGCSHTCRNMPGGYKCLCPKGFRLQANNHTCITGYIKACSVNNGGCDHICEDLNNGRHRCTCKIGFDLLSDGMSCEEASSFFECHVKSLNNGRVKCTTGGEGDYVAVGTQCLYNCDKGYKLTGEALRTCEYSGEWDLEEPVCAETNTCSKLVQPLKGRIIPHVCSMGKTREGQNCGIHCRSGHKLVRSDLANFTCQQHGDSLQWSIVLTEELLKNACVQQELPKPFIRCPSGGKMSFVLPTGAHVMTVRINRPESNVDWWRYVTSVPFWGKQLSTVLPPGRFEVVFTAMSPHPDAHNLSSSCNLVIHVKDDEPPKVFNCPANQEVRLARGEYSKNVYWSEPSFEDNIGIRTVYKSKDPGSRFPYGLHHVNYIASDDAGNRAYCHFSINVVNYYQHEYSSPRMMTKYRSVLICPHGIQYMSNTPDNYDNSITTENGCKWTYIRLRNQMGQSGYRIPNGRYSYNQHIERSNQIRDIPYTTPAPSKRHYRERFSW